MTAPDTPTDGSEIHLTAVVVTCNRLEKLKATLDRLCAAGEAALRTIVVVDNASTDGTAEWLSGLTDPRLDVILSPTNTGGAGGFAQGMRRALDHHPSDWLVLMDDDGRPTDGALDTFHQLEPDAQGWSAVAAAVYYPDGEICDMNRPSKNPFWHLPVFAKTVLRIGSRDGFHIGPSAYEGTSPVPIDITSFVGFFVSAKAARRIPLPDPDLFIYGDDGLYSLALSQAGGALVFHPLVRFEHDCNTFDPETQKRFTPLWKVYYYHRNLLLLYRKAAGWWIGPLLLVVLPKWILKGRHNRGTSGRFYRLLGLAIWDGLRSNLKRTHGEILDRSGEGGT